MTDEIKLCAVCWRVVDTVVIHALGGIETPLAHRNAQGALCQGARSEVITGWGRLKQERP
jgi:hypothetical protein